MFQTVRFLRGSYNPQEYGKVSSGDKRKLRIDLARVLVSKGVAEYVRPAPRSEIRTVADPPIMIREPDLEIPTDEPKPEWPYSGSPEEYVAKHAHKRKVSKTVQKKLDLAREIIGS